MAKRKKKVAKKKRQYKQIFVGRFDSELKPYVFSDGETVEQALAKAGIILAEGEEVNNLSGDTLSLDRQVKAGESLIVVGNYKSLA